MRKVIVIALTISAFNNAWSQQKSFNPADLQKNALPANFYNVLPKVTGWFDDEHYIIERSAKSGVSEIRMINMTTGLDYEIAPSTPTTKPAPVKSISIKKNDLYFSPGYGMPDIQLTNDSAEEKNPTFSPDKNRVAYTKNNNLFCYDIATSKEIQLTHDTVATILNGYASWVYYEEIFGRATKYKAFWWSPDSRTIAYMRFDENQIPMYPLYNADGVHGSIEETRYPLPGDANPVVKLGFVTPDSDSAKTTWIKFDSLIDHQLGLPSFSPDGKKLYVQWQNRGQDTLRIYSVNTNDASKQQVYFETQKTWVNLKNNRINFVNDGKNILIESDKTGWNHLYLHTNDGTLKNAVTTGNFQVKEIKLTDEKNGMIYFTARSLERTAETHLYRVRLNGNELKKLTPDGYDYSSIFVSPSGKYFVANYSNPSTPATQAVFDYNGKLVNKIKETKGSEFEKYKLAKTELIYIKSADGKFQLPAMVTWPANMDPKKKYPILISIYGGPDAGSVMNNWTWTPKQQWFAEEGLIQVAFDHRASGHYGKAGVNYMYRNLGYWEMEDYKTMAKWFIDNGQADPKKVCITGFSYGGYLSCYALTYGADVFTHGMAGGSVTDWRLYDSHYTERFMDKPSENPAGYKSSSVMTHAEKYKGMLQIVHGTMDDNVHVQNSLQLIGALEDQGKDFEMMLYPTGRHGWSNLAARYNHFNNLKTKFIYKYLLEKKAPAGLLK